ncbi:MAG: ATP-binding protein [Clostridia bacterium]|nr:ATP-binding protein [Clostridia bacterium]
MKYTRTGGIRIFSPEKKVIAIEDTGIGIAPEDLPRVFEKGFTGKNGRVEKSASGIGLYLCRRVADKLGAKMRITSSPGEGTTVFIDLGEAETIRE